MIKNTILIYIIIFLINPTIVFSQSTHERLGVWEESQHILSPGIQLSHFYSYLTGEEYHFFIPQVNLYYRIYNRLYFNMNFPVWIRVHLTEPSNRYELEFGDPVTGIGYQWKTNNNIFSIELNYTYPLGNWNEHQTGLYGFISGSGFHNLEIGTTYNKIIDPLILNTKLSYKIGLPRNERFGQSWEPGLITLELGFIEALNDRIGWCITMKNELYLPTIINGQYNHSDIDYTLSMNFTFLYYKDNNKFNLSILKELTDIIASYFTTLEADYDINIGD